MSEGEFNFTTEGQAIVRFDNTPIPKGVYDGKLRTRKAEKAVREEPGGFPYIKYRIEVLGTAPAEGKKNKLLFCNAYLSLRPSDKDGVVMPLRGGGIGDLAKALGEEIVNPPTVDVRDEEGKTWKCLDPNWVLEWLQERDDRDVRVDIRIRKQRGESQNEVSGFLPADGEEK